MAETRVLATPDIAGSLWTALLALIMLAWPAAAQDQRPYETPPLRVVSAISPPNAFLDSRRKPAGFAVDLILALGERMGRGVEFTFTANMQEALAAIATGRADILAGVVSTPERARIIAFSHPFSKTNVVLYALRDRAPGLANSDFADLRIGVRAGGLAESTVFDRLGVAPTLFDTVEETMIALNTAAVDLVAAPQAQWEHILRVLGIENRYALVGEPLVEGALSIGVDLRQPELLREIDAELIDFMGEARFETLREKWFGPQSFWTVEMIGMGSAAVIAAVLASWLTALARGRNRLRSVEHRETLRREELAHAYGQELERKNALLKYSNSEMEHILFAVTHDLKSPIVTVRGFAGVLEEAAQDGDVVAMQSASKRILAGTEKLGIVTDALLAFGSFGRSEIVVVDLDLKPVLDDVKTMLHTDFIAAGALLDVRQPLDALRADPSQFLRLVLNLIGNAVRYGCPTPGMTIEVSTESTNDGTIVNVRDHGPGVPENQRQEVFRLFRRYGPARPESTGLGLAIVQKIALKHGGSCWIEDGHGGGAVFRVFFPNQAAAATHFAEHRKSA